MGCPGDENPWTHAELDVLRDAHARRLGLDAVMPLLPGRTPAAILSRAKKRGIRLATSGDGYRSATAADDEAIRALWQRGVSHAQIGVDLRVIVSSVGTRIRAMQADGRLPRQPRAQQPDGGSVRLEPLRPLPFWPGCFQDDPRAGGFARRLARASIADQMTLGGVTG
jgi:hypothetical protein